jgi:phasin
MINVTSRLSGAEAGARELSIVARADHRGEQQEDTTMAGNQTHPFEVPPEMRALAEKSVTQARQAFEGFISAAQRTVSTLEGQAETARKGAKDVGEKAMSFAESNIASSFEFAQKLVRAKDVEEMLKLQSDYIKNQMQALSDQAKELGETTGQAARDATKPKI